MDFHSGALSQSMSGICSLAGNQNKDLKDLETWLEVSQYDVITWLGSHSLVISLRIDLRRCHQGWWRTLSGYLHEPVDIDGQKNARKWEATIGFQPTCTAPLRLLFWSQKVDSKSVSKNSFTLRFFVSRKTDLQRLRQTPVDLWQCWSPTMRKRKNICAAICRTICWKSVQINCVFPNKYL